MSNYNPWNDKEKEFLDKVLFRKESEIPRYWVRRKFFECDEDLIRILYMFHKEGDWRESVIEDDKYKLEMKLNELSCLGLYTEYINHCRKAFHECRRLNGGYKLFDEVLQSDLDNMNWDESEKEKS